MLLQDQHCRFCLSAAPLLCVLPSPGLKGSGYHQVKRITLGGEGRWDYFDVEQGTHHIFIPRGTHVMVLDADGKLLGE